jgi:hypothetical protein
MSEIKVNKISPRAACGTVQLGDSGDTFTIPAGASITNSGTASGFGATGAASWNTTVKTGDFTAVAGEGYFVNTTSGAVNVTLPAGSAGSVIAIKDYAGTFDTNNVTLTRNGSDKIGGQAINATLSTEGQAVTLVFVDSTQGWLVTDSGLQSDASTEQFIVATGGTITTCGNFKVHKFTGPGTFTVCSVGNACGSNSVDYLVVAGGGGGGGECQNSGGAAGGGAGGLRIGAVTPSPCHSPLVATGLTVTAAGFPITVGAGGTAGPQSAPGNGGNGGVSTFSTITSTGGGGGGKSVPPSVGNPGGSGGGGNAAGGTGNTPPVSPAQGTNGATGGGPAGTCNAGGGGAVTAGANVPGPVGGQSGGPGLQVTPVFGNAPKPFYIANGPDNGASACGQFAGGGAGGHDNRPATSLGGVGGGANVPGPQGFGSAGTTNTGGGGGGGGEDVPAPGGQGGAGGSGIVLIRYKFQ